MINVWSLSDRTDSVHYNFALGLLYSSVLIQMAVFVSSKVLNLAGISNWFLIQCIAKRDFAVSRSVVVAT